MTLRDELITPTRHGKVRDIYELPEWLQAKVAANHYLILFATDRISAFDHILPTDIPDKGLVLAQLAAFWFEQTGDVVPNHFVRLITSESIPEVGERLPPEFAGRAMLVRRANRIDIECIVRGYLSGSGWESYRDTGEICGIRLPSGLRESEELPEPIFTPTTKADEGHDEPMTFKQVVEMVGRETANAIRVRSLALYKYGRDYARDRGIIIADTKFEFGWADNEVGEQEPIVIDEIFTPDSSRFWPPDQYEPGHAQPSFDKQFVRDYLSGTGWDKESQAPELPAHVVAKTTEKYLDAFRRLTGRELIR
jgi:phosphoribosylaminoimidazole-succinocarboxamide synthase